MADALHIHTPRAIQPVEEIRVGPAGLDARNEAGRARRVRSRG